MARYEVFRQRIWDEDLERTVYGDWVVWDNQDARVVTTFTGWEPAYAYALMLDKDYRHGHDTIIMNTISPIDDRFTVQDVRRLVKKLEKDYERDFSGNQ